MLCGEIYSMKPHPENPKRWRKAKLCRTADQEQNQKSFKEAFLQNCVQRNDQWSKDVHVRVKGAVSHLHAWYTRKCPKI